MEPNLLLVTTSEAAIRQHLSKIAKGESPGHRTLSLENCHQLEDFDGGEVAIVLIDEEEDFLPSERDSLRTILKGRTIHWVFHENERMRSTLDTICPGSYLERQEHSQTGTISTFFFQWGQSSSDIFKKKKLLAEFFAVDEANAVDVLIRKYLNRYTIKELRELAEYFSGEQELLLVEKLLLSRYPDLQGQLRDLPVLNEDKMDRDRAIHHRVELSKYFFDY